MPDASIGTPTARPGAPMRRLKDMMADIGYRPSDVTYFAISHGHGDHAAMPTTSGIDVAGERGRIRGHVRGEGPALLHAGDLQCVEERQAGVYRRRSRCLWRRRGGDQADAGTRTRPSVLIVRLAKTGTVALPGDLYHYPEEIALRVVAPAQGDEALTLKARDALQAVLEEGWRLLKRVGGQMWITHDLIGFSRLKKSPEFYE